MPTLLDDFVSPASRAPSSAVVSRSRRPLFTGMMLVPSSHPSTAKAPTRHAVSRTLRGERIDHEVHGEAGVVHRLKALAVRMVVPLGAVVLAAVQHSDPAVAPICEQVLVHEVVAPPVQLVAGGGRSLEFKEC